MSVQYKILNVQDKYKIKIIKCLSVCLHVCTYACMLTYGHMYGPPGVWGIWGEWLFIFKELGSTGNYFYGAGEQAHGFRDLGSPAKSKK